MPKFKITDSETGRSLIVNGDRAPTEDEAAEIFAQNPGKPESAVQSAEKVVGLGAKGLADSVLETIGAVPDAVAWAFRKVGIPAPNDPGYYTKGLKRGYNELGQALAAPVRALGVPDTELPSEPQTDAQKLAYGAGHGIGDAASIAVPAAGVARLAKEGSTVKAVAKALAAQPIAQTVAGGAGGAVGQETGSPTLGILASLGAAGLTGAARSGATKLYRPDLSDLTDAEPKAARDAATYVGKLASSAKKSAPDLVASATGGKPVTAAEAIGRPGIGALAALGRRAGATPDALEGLLTSRAEGMPDRILSDFAETLGISPEAASGNVEALIEAAKSKAAPLYQQAYKANQNIASSEIDRILATPAGKKALAGARDLMQNDQTLMGVVDPELLAQAKEAGQKLPFKGGVASGLKLQTYDYVKRALDDQINAAFRAGNKQEGGILASLKSKFVKALDDADVTAKAGPNSMKPEGGFYAQARRTAGEYLDAQSQFQSGQKVLFDPNVSPKQVAELVASLSEPSAQAYRGGVASRLFAMAQNGKLKPNALNTPAIKAKLAALFGEDGASAFIERVKTEAKMAASGNRMKPGLGSPTAELTEAMADQNSGINLKNAIDLGSAGLHLSHGNMMPALIRLGQVAGDTVFSPRRAVMPVATRDEAGRLLMMAPDELGNYLGQVDNATKAALPSYLRGEISKKDLVAALLAARGKDLALSPN